MSLWRLPRPSASPSSQLYDNGSWGEATGGLASSASDYGLSRVTFGEMDYSNNLALQGLVPDPELSDADLEVIEGLLSTGGEPASPAELEFVVTKINETRSLRSTVECTTWLEDETLLARLNLLEQLYSYTEGNAALVRHIVTNRDVSPVTVRDVARGIHRLGLAKASTSTSEGLSGLDTLRRHLFESEPTALMCGLIEADVIPVASTVKEHVLLVLDNGLERGFNIRHQSLNLLLDSRIIFKPVPTNLWTRVKEWLSAIVRLHQLVEDPEHVAVLLLRNYSSAHSISSVSKSEFLAAVRGSSIDDAKADAIWTRSMATHIRNQAIVIDKMKEKHEIAFMGAFLFEKHGSPAGPPTKPADLSNLFYDLNQMADCAECSSVTSPGAYFVDLLRQLSLRASDPTQKSSSSTLLQELFKRRPDLGDLRLSCANTKTLVPYIDLANEALESVAFNGSGMVKDSYNATNDDDEYDEDPNTAQSTMVENTNFKVYSHLVQPLIFPLQTFPYNDAVESVRAYLEALTSSRRELVDVFRAPYRLVPSTILAKDDDTKDPVIALAQDVSNRGISAEYLGLVSEDYVAIAHEAFQSKDYLDAVNGAPTKTTVSSYQSSIGVTDASAYWGYPDDTEMLSDTKGLTCISGQFLRRSALTFEDMLRVLETGYMSRRLVISSASTGKQEYSGLVADMRLRHYPPDQHASAVIQTGECDDLQAFLRLWRKVGWSLEDLDAAVVMLATKGTGIDPIIIDGLAEIKRISSLSQVPVGDLLPLWGNMNTGWAKSAYARLFLQPRVTREDPVFVADKNGKYLASISLKVSEHRETIMSTLLLTNDELDSILKGAAWIGDALTIQSISYIYRISLFSRMLGVSPVQYPKILLLISSKLDVFSSPRYTRGVLEQFQQFKKVGWTLDTQLFVVGNVMDTTGVPAGFIADTAISATLDIIKGNVSVASDNGVSSNTGTSTATTSKMRTKEKVAKVSAALFGEEIGSKVERFIEGEHTTTREVAIRAQVEVPHRLRHKVQLVKNPKTGRWSLSLTGFLTRDERHELAGLIGPEQSRSLSSSSTALYHQHLWPIISAEHAAVFRDESSEPTGSSWAERAEKHETRTLRRRTAFLKDGTPILCQKMCQKTVLKIMGSVLPTIDVVVLETLLCDVIRVANGKKPSITAMNALCRLSPPNPTLETFDGYFWPSGTDSYTFVAITQTAPKMILNGSEVEFHNAIGNIWQSTKAHRLAGNVWYTLQLSGCSIDSFSYNADQGPSATPLSSMLIEKASVQVVSGILVKLSRASIPITLYKLQREEVQYFQGLATFDFGALSFANMKDLHAYADLRDTIPKPEGKDAVSPLINLFKTLGSWDSSQSLVSQLVLATRWPGEVLRAVLAAKYPSCDEKQLAAILKNAYALSELRDIMAFLSRPEFVGLSPELLFSLAQPALPSKRVDPPSKPGKKSSKKSSKHTTGGQTSPIKHCTCNHCDCGIICPASYGRQCHPRGGRGGGRGGLTVAPESLPADELSLRLQQLSQGTTLAAGDTTASLYGKPGDTMVRLYGKTVDQTYQDASELRLALCAGRNDARQGFAAADDKLRTSRRNALVQYLLQQTFIKTSGIADADALCGHLLIDVQTGPALRTSRLKQAISTVQTFMQRCILGLEKSSGIANGAISRDDYEYLIRYRLWEANRKAFLYPESWIDPTLRDDKSEQFRALEAALSRGKPTEDAVGRAVSDYVYAMHGVGNLEIASYLWDRYDSSGARSRLHFFGRTRAAPWQFYYRKMDLVGKQGHQTAFWEPWEKMSVDVQVHELSGDAFNKMSHSGCYVVPALLGSRLFLFLPHFTSSTLADPLGASMKDKSPRDLGDRKVSESAKQKQWQMRMGWTEYRNGKWTQKQMTSDVLLINGEINDYQPAGYRWPDDWSVDDGEENVAENLAGKFPGIETFQYWVSQRSIQSSTTDAAEDAIVIDMHRWVGSTNSFLPVLNDCYNRFYAYKLATYEWRGERLVLLNPNDITRTWKWPVTIPTYFTRLGWWARKGSQVPVPKNKVGGADMLLTRLKSPSEDSLYSTAVSFNTVNVGAVSGLVVDVSTQNRIKCIVGYPPADARFTTSDWDVGCFFNTVSSSLVHAAEAGKDQIYATLSQLPLQFQPDAFGAREHTIPHELANPYSLYTWETAVHVISLLMERFLSTHQYELALTVARLLFDPAAVGADSDVTKCWKFIPFRDPAVQAWSPLDQKSGNEGKIDLYEYNLDKANVHAAARGRPVAYMKRIVLKYIETLIALGDQLFQQNTLETIPLAIQRYIEAAHLFGRPPIRVPQIGKKTVLSYNKLVSSVGLDDYSNALVKMELEFPFRADYVGSTEPVPFIKTNYFCIPANPQLASLRALLDDRLYKCRNSLDIDGHKQNLPLFEPPIDVDALIHAAAAGLGPSAVLSDLVSPMPRYRFVYLLERALDLCRELKETDARVLAVKEKRDYEALGILSARHNTSVNALMMDLKRAQKAEELAAIETLQETRRTQEARLRFWLSLTGDDVPSINSASTWQEVKQSVSKPTMDEFRMTVHEHNEMEHTQSAMHWNRDSNEKEHSASILDAFPQLYANFEPWGLGVSVEAGFSILARMLRIGAADSAKEAQSASEKSQLSGMSARLENQLRERRESANQAGRDIKVTDRMLAVARARVAVCDRDLRAQQQQLDNAAEMDEWLRSKYTSAQLYEWMDKQYGMVFQRAYSLCGELARQAQRAYLFERPAERLSGGGDKFLREAGGGYWDSARHGALSAENLWLDLKRMESAYRNKKSHDFELVKNVSLRQVDPWALMLFRETGHTVFTVPEFLFDVDFPGHFCRRIVSVSLQIPCVVGPYTSLNCTLRLVQHRYRVSSDVNTSLPYLETGANDPRFRTDNIPINAVALGSPTPNSATAGTGIFSLDFARDKYSPFEGAGAISTWQIDLPPEFRQFDYRTISDVVLQLRYTAFDGGVRFGLAASGGVQDTIKKPLSSPYTAPLAMLVNVASDYATSWYAFRSDLQSGRAGTLRMPGMAALLPFWTQSLKITVDSIWVVVIPPPADGQDIRLDKMTIAEYSSLSWTQTRGFGGDGGPSVDDCSLLKASRVNKDMAQDWTLSLPNDSEVGLTLDAIWILVYYYAEAKG
ncbi:hypothetical protein F5Y14DRAFT_453113 [Nemania sp. NC0429]|nr:hypothetical protein F5Y14DRAFT_453113 [Nemania sp. NC0429]